MGPTTSSSPHHHQHQHSQGSSPLPPSSYQIESPLKRKLETVIAASPSKLQTTNLVDARTFGDANTLEGTLSPRAAVSARMQGLHLRGSSSSPTATALRVSVPLRGSNGASPAAAVAAPGSEGTGRRESWTVEQGWDTRQFLEFGGMDSGSAENGRGTENAGVAREMEIGEQHSASSIEIAESSQGDERSSFKHDVEQGIFEFKAGGKFGFAEASRAGMSSPFKRAAFAVEDDDDNDEEKRNMMSPSKRRRRKTPSRSPSPPPMQPIPRAHSPSARRLSHRSPPPSDMSSSPGEAENALYWWQPSEIVGHDPEDPEEDHRGVNGIGYQKTKAEQWKIAEKKKRQIAEWRSREAKEARSLRAGGRRVIMGRVSKPGSRAGSPIDNTVRGRSSPAPRSVSDEKKMEEVVRRAVRFDLG